MTTREEVAAEAVYDKGYGYFNMTESEAVAETVLAAAGAHDAALNGEQA